jgi:hypothetical protein
MTRRRRGRRPDAPREDVETGQPRVGPDGRPDDRGTGYTPPASPLTRWQNHGRGQRRNDMNAGPGRSRWSVEQFGLGRDDRRDDRRGAPPADRPRPRPDARPVQHRHEGRGRPGPPRPAAPPAPRGAAASIDPFELFCAYHLGITTDGGYRIQNIHEVARRFGTNAAELRQILTNLGMAADDIVHSGFDLPTAQVDIMVAPEGISRRELARPLYEEFRNAPKKTRDWAREMEDAQRQIDETIGRDGRWSPAPRDPAGKQS